MDFILIIYFLIIKVSVYFVRYERKYVEEKDVFLLVKCLFLVYNKFIYERGGYCGEI